MCLFYSIPVFIIPHDFMTELKKRFQNMGIRRKHFFIMLPILFLLSGIAFALSPPGGVVFPKEVTIPRDSSAREAAAILAGEGVVRSEGLLLLTLLFERSLEKIQAGTYFFERAHWLHEVVAAVTDPFTRKIQTVRIPDGSSLRGIAAEFEAQGLFASGDLWAVTGMPAVDYREQAGPPDFTLLEERFPFLAGLPPRATLEGYLFPDTYEMFDTTTPTEAVFKMLQNFESALTGEGLFDEIQQDGRPLHEILTLASLLEREAITYEDKRIIAGIIQNRLERDMPLQLDASLMYVTGRGSLLLTKDDLASDSPYNTYTHKGLPRGPIANPGLDSIKAALSPKETPYLYYLSDRSHVIYYSETHEEHILKKQTYLP